MHVLLQRYLSGYYLYLDPTTKLKTLELAVCLHVSDVTASELLLQVPLNQTISITLVKARATQFLFCSINYVSIKQDLINCLTENL